jgi:hypothetical protein
MDKMKDSGSFDMGSIPVGITDKKPIGNKFSKSLQYLDIADFFFSGRKGAGRVVTEGIK